MKSLLLVFGFFIGVHVHAQVKIELDDAGKHVGDSVRVEGKIFSVKTFENAQSPILVNLGAAFPNQKLTLAVYRSAKGDSSPLPDESFVGAIAVVTGKIELFKGKPQIVVREPNQLSMVPGNATVPKKN